MIDLLAKGVVLAAGLYLVGLGMALMATPARASRFLMGHASSAPLHYLEVCVRIGVGLAFVQHAPQMMAPGVFRVIGWVLAGTSVALLLVPWHWHRRLAESSVPLALRFTPLLGVASLLLGAGLLVAALPGAR
jgi:hypothetical protein